MREVDERDVIGSREVASGSSSLIYPPDESQSATKKAEEKEKRGRSEGSSYTRRQAKKRRQAQRRTKSAEPHTRRRGKARQRYRCAAMGGQSSVSPQESIFALALMTTAEKKNPFLELERHKGSRLVWER